MKMATHFSLSLFARNFRETLVNEIFIFSADVNENLLKLTTTKI